MPTHGGILVNNRTRVHKEFHRICRYIPQEDHISPHLTVKEFMILASNFKFGSDLMPTQKMEKICELLQIFQLEKQHNTLVRYLSGGECKRLCIALELLNNPAVLILDEPTT